MTRLTLRLFGPPRLALDGAPVETDRRKALALLAYLAVTKQSHSREALAALFWPDYDQSRAYAYLRRTLWEINQAIADAIGFSFFSQTTSDDQPMQKRQLLNYLNQKQMLLVLDNFEHLLSGVSLLTDALRAAPQSSITDCQPTARPAHDAGQSDGHRRNPRPNRRRRPRRRTAGLHFEPPG